MKMESAIVAQFLGTILPLRVFSAMVNRLWGYEGEIVISRMKEGVFLIEIPSVRLCNWILARFWHIHHSMLLMRRWTEGITPLDLEVKQVPTWLTLTGIPPQLLTNEGIS
ncbi:hypothetical protein LINGRAHAP2_LOCUS23893 [Linum grandiflorum]